MRYLLSVLIVFSLFACSDKEAVLELSDYEQDILNYVNVYRESEGLAVLEYEPVVQHETATHNKQMADGTVGFSHDGFSDRAARIKAEIGGSNVAENIAYGPDNAFQLLSLWRGSEGHNANLLGNYNKAGVSAIQNADGTWFYTMMFLKNN